MSSYMLLIIPVQNKDLLPPTATRRPPPNHLPTYRTKPSGVEMFGVGRMFFSGGWTLFC
jgi:hypothetical protein